MPSHPKAVATRKVIFFLVATACAVFGQRQEDPVFQSGVNLVLMEVSVTNSKGVPVAALEQAQFEIKEGRRLLDIVRFEPGSTDVSVILVADCSRSMTPRRDALNRGVAALVQQFKAGDEGVLIAFNERVDVVSDFESFSKPSDWLQNLARRPMTGQTALYDAVIAASRKLAASSHERRVIIVLSDGADTASTASLDAAFDEIRSSNGLVYTVGLFNVGEPDTNAGALKRLAEITGGTASFDPNGANLPEVFEKIMKDLRSRYVLGFYAQSPVPGKVEVRRLSVSAHDSLGKELKVRSRREYRIGNR
ncbi:MAG: VWA domain-containing protein [Bryobacteraceae bacterium]